MNVAKRSRKRGAILIDAMMGMAVVAMGGAAVFCLIPTVHRSHIIGDRRARATSMARKMVQNIQMLSANSITGSVLSNLKLIDEGQAASPYSFSQIPLDDGAGYSPSTALPKGTGTLTVTNLPGGAVKATARITWKGVSGTESYTLGTVVGGYR